MKLCKPLIATLGMLLVGVTSLAHADDGYGHDDQRYHDQRHDDRHDDHRDDHRGPPPHDFSPYRHDVEQYREHFGRAERLPPGVQVMRGRPLPPGYGRPLDRRALEHLPYYPGYEWRGFGPDLVLIAVGTGVVYEVMQGVLPY
ncbi:MAG: anti-virulence regulator CigR family protein [Pseudomonas sp.]|uniref:anti-virulence regulator CigR family protein n=1 Tax=Pseudomonas abieticivorans TaxID=2931382 RepID=UPI0020C16AC1|nr:anti-virulence regulator CigR family protein [Pseudomonas sp. PIA16]MDE1167483.1 anti-virulence regulator CigR family protein [Pseudomonas sp.]